jgi:hypothetical protein
VKKERQRLISSAPARGACRSARPTATVGTVKSWTTAGALKYWKFSRLKGSGSAAQWSRTRSS